jgi:predicted DsbA family dithiol-disulfide isomerase
LDIVSDVVCPWCFIGLRRLERALASIPRAEEIEVRWRAFELNPGLPPEGVDRKSFHAAKFGGEEQMKDAYARVAAVGAEEGIVFAQDKILKQPNTTDAHRLLALAAARGKQTALMESLFRAFFCEGLDVGDRKILARRAGEVGMDAEKSLHFLESGEHAAGVAAEQARYRKMGVRSVPTFIFNNRFALVGAEPVDLIRGALEEALKPPVEE